MLCDGRVAGFDVLAHIPTGCTRRSSATSINADRYVTILASKSNDG